MELLSPCTGLLIWQAIIFGLLFFLLAKLAWKPIMQSLKIREETIQDALDSAEKAKEEMAKLQSDNQKLLDEARKARDTILKEARDIANKLKEDAKADATKEGQKLIEDAKAAILTEKNAAMAEVRSQVAELSLEITEKVLRKELSSDKAQKELIKGFVKDIKLN